VRIALIGSGGVGGFFGARLAHGGADVSFLARGAHLAAIKSRGISIEGGPEPIRVEKVSATDDPSKMDVADLVIFAVKLFETVLEQIRPVVGPHTAIISF
jgi:2-dehydropantoate 2-reductase